MVNKAKTDNSTRASKTISVKEYLDNKASRQQTVTVISEFPDNDLEYKSAKQLVYGQLMEVIPYRNDMGIIKLGAVIKVYKGGFDRSRVRPQQWYYLFCETTDKLEEDMFSVLKSQEEDENGKMQHDRSGELLPLMVYNENPFFSLIAESSILSTKYKQELIIEARLVALSHVPPRTNQS
ncbi:MAG: hypothetical protein AAGB12_15790 [Pseudomonadota bacterium]